MNNPNPNVLLPYDDFCKIKEGADKAEAVLKLLGTEFPDATCQIIAIKSVIGYVEPTPEEPEEPGNDEPSNDPDNSDPDETPEGSTDDTP